MADVTVSGVHYHVSDKVRAYVNEKLADLNRFHPSLKRIQATIHEQSKHGFRIDVEMHLPNNHDMAAHKEDETVYSAIDGVADKCAKQLRRLHYKQADHHMRARA